MRRGGVVILSKDKLSKLAEDLLSNPVFAQAFTTAVQKGFETKGAIDRNLQTVLGLLNVPSRADFAKLLTKMEVLQGSLANLTIKVDRLLAAERRRRRAERAQSAEDDLPPE